MASLMAYIISVTATLGFTALGLGAFLSSSPKVHANGRTTTHTPSSMSMPKKHGGQVTHLAPRGAFPIGSLLGGLILLLTVCQAQGGGLPGLQAAASQLKGLPQAELAAVAELSGQAGLQTYSYVEFLRVEREDGSLDFRMIWAEDVAGQLRLPVPDALFELGSGLYEDGQGNGSFFGDMSRRGEVLLPYALTLFADGSYAFALDVGRDDLVDLALGGMYNDMLHRAKFWMSATPFGKLVWECLTAGRALSPRLVDMLTALGREGADTGQGNPCALVGSAGQKDIQGPGHGFRGIGFPGPDLLGEPECDSGPKGGIADGPPLDATSSSEEESGTRLAAPPPSKPSEPTDLSPEAAARAWIAERIAEEETREFFEVSDSERSDTEQQVMERFEGLVRQVKDFIFEAFVGGYTHRWIPPVGPNGSPEAAFEDPRCQGLEIDTARGTLFSNPHFCQGDDLLTCTKRQEDAIFALTGGQCEVVTGPDGREIMMCKQEEAIPVQPPEDSPGSSNAGPTDLPCRSDQQPGCGRPGSPEIAPDFISTTPLGGIIMSVCAADCPQIPQW
jgi:hypothetical protein